MSHLKSEKIVEYLLDCPADFGNAIGFDKLTDLHNGWIKDMINCQNADVTLQAHRGSYKTTCVSIALAIIIILYPKKRTMFMRKTDNDIKEVIRQVQKILMNDYSQRLIEQLYDKKLMFTTSTSDMINTNLSNDTKGTAQLVGLGMGGSITGKHFDLIFTDDIVNVSDRTSKAERDRTKIIYQELQNIKNRDGRIYNTGTPWHKDDCFTLMPNPKVYDCYTTGLISDDELSEIKSHMTPSLFSANYEMRHIADDDIIFVNPKINAEPHLCEQGIAHIDASYGGEDYTAFTICKRTNGKYYVFGKMWHKHIEDVEDEVIAYRKQFNAGKIHCENNADKGYLAKSLRNKGERVAIYHEDMNKFLKITSYLRYVWNDVYFVAGTDKAYIEQICDFGENAEHDDAPDSLASIIRIYSRKSETEYKPMFM